MIEFPTTYYLYLASVLFCSGLFVVLTKRNSIFILIGIELMLNSGNLFLITFSKVNANNQGQVLAIFSVVLTVCEIAIALAVLLNVYKHFKTSDLDEIQEIGTE